MLTKQDFEEFEKIIDKKLKSILIEIATLKTQIEDLEIKMDETKTDLNLSIFQVRGELQQEAKHIKRRLNQLYEGQEIIIKYANEEVLELKNRVDRIEDHLKLPQI